MFQSNNEDNLIEQQKNIYKFKIAEAIFQLMKKYIGWASRQEKLSNFKIKDLKISTDRGHAVIDEAIAMVLKKMANFSCIIKKIVYRMHVIASHLMMDNWQI